MNESPIVYIVHKVAALLNQRQLAPYLVAYYKIGVNFPGQDASSAIINSRGRIFFLAQPQVARGESLCA